MKSSIVFLIRAYNEATRIREVIEGIFSAGYGEVLVVDDGSTDGTEALLSDWIENRQIHYVRHVTNRGAGAALETGFSYIRENH
jgi:glycosyltransferase involved in cell wall biosynthesis